MPPPPADPIYDEDWTEGDTPWDLHFEAFWDNDDGSSPEWTDAWSTYYPNRRNPFTCVYYRDYSYLQDSLSQVGGGGGGGSR